MKQVLFLDDVRNISDVTWVEYPKEFEVLNFRTMKSLVNYINIYCKNRDWSNVIFSLDHDLQEFDRHGEERTGYTFIKFIIDYFIDNDLNLDDLNVIIHTKNPIGCENIKQYLFNARLNYFK